MRKYSRADFLKLIESIKDELDFEEHIFHEDIRGFLLKGVDGELFRLIYEEKEKRHPLLLSFSANINTNDAITIYAWLKDMVDLSLMEEFYVSSSGECSFGQNAASAYYDDIENEILESLTSSVSKEEPSVVTMVSEEPIHPAFEDASWEANDRFKKRKTWQ